MQREHPAPTPSSALSLSCALFQCCLRLRALGLGLRRSARTRRLRASAPALCTIQPAAISGCRLRLRVEGVILSSAAQVDRADRARAAPRFDSSEYCVVLSPLRETSHVVVLREAAHQLAHLESGAAARLGRGCPWAYCCQLQLLHMQRTGGMTALARSQNNLLETWLAEEQECSWLERGPGLAWRASRTVVSEDRARDDAGHAATARSLCGHRQDAGLPRSCRSPPASRCSRARPLPQHLNPLGTVHGGWVATAARLARWAARCTP